MVYNMCLPNKFHYKEFLTILKLFKPRNPLDLIFTQEQLKLTLTVTSRDLGSLIDVPQVT